MRAFNLLLGIFTGIAAIVCVMLGVHEASNNNYDESAYYLLLCIINYMTCLDCMNEINKKE